MHDANCQSTGVNVPIIPQAKRGSLLIDSGGMEGWVGQSYMHVISLLKEATQNLVQYNPLWDSIPLLRNSSQEF